MENRFCIGLAIIILLGEPGAALAQSVPDSNMARPSGNTGGADNGIGQQGRLTGDAGSHSSTVKGAAAAAQIPINPKPANASHDDPQVEKDPSQGGTQQH
jgi:hypothetical protein